MIAYARARLSWVGLSWDSLPSANNDPVPTPSSRRRPEALYNSRTAGHPVWCSAQHSKPGFVCFAQCSKLGPGLRRDDDALSHFPLPTSHFPLPTSHFPLPTSHFPLPTAYFRSIGFVCFAHCSILGPGLRRDDGALPHSLLPTHYFRFNDLPAVVLFRSALRGMSWVRTRALSRVTATSSSIRRPMPRQRAATPLASGGI